MATRRTSHRPRRPALQELAKRHLWMHFTRMGAYADARRPDHRARRGLLRLGRARQPLPRRPLGALLLQHRPRPRRRRAGRRRPGERARLLHHLVLRAPAGDRAGRGSPRSRPGTSTASSSPAAAARRSSRRSSSPASTTSSPATRPRRRSSRARSPTTAPPRRAGRDGHPGAARAVRAAHARRLPRPQHERLPPARRRRRRRRSPRPCASGSCSRGPTPSPP